jgi:hypothetical protein
MARVVVVEWHPSGPVRETVELRDETTKGDWQEWVANRIGISHDEDDEMFLHPTVVPGVSLVSDWSTGSGDGNWATRRVISGRHQPRYETSYPIGPGVALAHTDDFGGRLLNLSGPQRVAIELAAYGEWDPLFRSVARIEKGIP